MAESVDALVSNTSGAIHPGSIPGLGTKSCKFLTCGSFLCKITIAQMAESVDALVSNTSGATHPGSIPGLGTKSCKYLNLQLFLFLYTYKISIRQWRIDIRHRRIHIRQWRTYIRHCRTKLLSLSKIISSYRKSYLNLRLLQSFMPSAGTTVGDWLLWLMTTDWRRTSLFTYSLNSPKVTSPLVSCNFFRR